MDWILIAEAAFVLPPHRCLCQAQDEAAATVSYVDCSPLDERRELSGAMPHPQRVRGSHKIRTLYWETGKVMLRIWTKAGGNMVFGDRLWDSIKTLSSA